MKNQLQLIFVLFLISISFINKGYAQCPNLQFVDMRGTPGFPQTDLINVCGDPDTLSILIFTDDPGEISGFEMTVNFVTGMRYAGFENAHFGGSTNISNTDPDISSPSFLAGGITSGEIFVANIGVTGDCSVDLTSNDYFIEIDYSFFFTNPAGQVFQCKGTETVENDFNNAMKVPVVNMVTPSPIDVTVTSLGTPACQTVVLSQDGLQAYVNEVDFSICGIDTGTGSPVSISSMTANNIDILSTATYSPGDTSWLAVLDGSIFSSNSSTNANGTPEQFDTGEKVTLRICYEVATCPSGADIPFTYKASYGCFDEVCQLSGQASFLKVRPTGSALPTISASLDNGIEICGEDAQVSATVTNPNTDTDQNVYTDLSIGFQACGMEALDITQVLINGVDVTPTYTVISSDIDIDLSMNTNPGIGLYDYDGDGFFDDLPGSADPLDVVVKFAIACGIGTDGGCPEINCENVQFYVKGKTNCGNAFQGFPPTDGFNLQYGQQDASNIGEVDFNTAGTVVGYDFGNYSNDGAPVAADASEVEIEFCYEFAQQNIEDCPSGGQTKMVAHLAGAKIFIDDFSVVPGSVMMDDGTGYAPVADALVTYTQTSDATATIEINQGSNSSTLCYKYTLRLDDCHCGPTQYVAVDQQIVSVCSDCTPDCEIVKGCRSTLFRANPECSPCPCIAQYFPTKTERKNLGYVDKEMTRKITRDELLAANAVDLGRFMPGDTLWHQGYWELYDGDILFTDPQRWQFFFYASTMAGSGTSGEVQAALPLTWEGGSMQLNELKVENPDGTTHVVDMSMLAGCANGGTRTGFNSLATYFLTPWGDNPDDEYESTYTCSYTAWEGYDNDFTNLNMWNYDRMTEVNTANSSLATRHDWGQGDCLNEFLETYGIVTGTKIHFDWCVPLIKNPLREMAKILGVEPVEQNIARIIPGFYAYEIDEIAGNALYGAGPLNTGCTEVSTYNISCPGGLKSETNIVLDNCGGTIEHELVVEAFAGVAGDEWFTHEYRPLMEIHDLELPIFSPLAYCANAQVDQNGIITPVTVDSTINLACSPVAGYSDDLCSVDAGSDGAIVIDLYSQGFTGLGIGLGNCDTIKLSYDYCMICPAPLDGLLDYEIKADWCYIGGTPNECDIAGRTFYNPRNTGGASTLGDDANAAGFIGASWHNQNYYNIFNLDTLYCKEDDTQGIVFLDDSAVTPMMSITTTNEGNDLIAAAVAGSSIEAQEVMFCNNDPMDATGFSGYVTVPNPVAFMGVCLDENDPSTALTTTLVSDDGQIKKYKVDMPVTTLTNGECVTAFVKTTLLFCPSPGALPPEICVGASSGCSPDDVRAAIGSGGGDCAASEICYAYIFGEADLQTEWFSMPSTPPALCETFTLHVRTKNVKELLLLNVDPNFTLPFGLNIVPNSWEVAYPGGAVDMTGNFGAWTSVPDPDVVNGLNVEWSDEAMWSSYIDANGLKGAFSTLDSNNIAFRFEVTTNCDEFLSGSKTRTETNASDPCGPGDLSSGVVESPQIIVEGADPADFAQLLVVGSPAQLFCGGIDNTFGLTALNVSDYPTTDSVVTCATIPGDVLMYTPGSVSFTNGFTPDWITETPIGSDMQVCFHSPALQPGEMWSVTFEAAMISTAPCGDIEVLADVKSVVEAVSCEPGPPDECDVFVQNSINPSIFIELSAPLETTDVRVSADCSAGDDPVQICYEIDLSNPGPAYNGNVNVAIHDDVTANGIVDSFDGILNSGDHSVTLANGESTTIMMCLPVQAIQSCPIVVRQTFETSCACDTHDTPINDLTPSWFAALDACVVLCPTQPLELETCGDFEITFDPPAGATMTDDGAGNVSISINDGFGVDAPVIINYAGSLGECEVTDSRQLKSLGDFIPQDSTYVYCEGECIDLDLGIPDAVVDGAEITWTPSDYLFDTTSPVNEACGVPETTVYDVEIRFGDACVFNVQHTVEFNPSGTIGIGGDAEMCQGNPPASITTDPGFDSYEWYQLSGGFEILAGVTTVPEWSGPIVAGAYIVKGYRSFDLCPSVSGVWNIIYAECVDLELEKEICDIDPVPNIGDTVTYCITVCNINDPALFLTHDANDVTIGDSWPPALTFESYTATSGTFIFSTPQSTWSIPVIANGTCETIEVRAIINDYGTIQNVAEITGSDKEDIDSEEDNDDGDQSEDDEDKEIIEIPRMDLALTKIICPTQVFPVTIGDDVTYCIEVTNQGSVDAFNVGLADYLPSVMELNDPDWTDNMDGTASFEFIDSVLVGETITVQMTATLIGVSPDPVVNTAEITGQEDRDGDPVGDIDSTPDGDPTNDGPATDQATDGTSGDEDDSDPAILYTEVVDMALKKTTTNTGPVSVGQDITYLLTIFNQGNVPTSNIVLTEYIPAGLALNAAASPGWTDMTTSATYTETSTIGFGDSVVVSITMTVQPGANPANLRNVAEITSFQDDMGFDITTHDIDSDGDNDPNNDGDMEDNSTDGTNGDEDDSDFEQLPVFDLALQKVISTPGPYSYGQTVTFDITVYNQGNLDAWNIDVFDYLTCGYDFAPSNTTWNYNAITDVANRVVNTTSPLLPGDSTVVSIDLIIVECAEEGAYTNTAEIGEATDSDGNPMPDLDSTPDSDPGNDGDITDNSTDGTNGDEDDSDFALIEIYDLALAKTISTPGPYSIGQNIVFDIWVYNQGSETVQNVEVSDYVPVGYSYDGALALNISWVGSGPTPTTLTQNIAGPIVAGDSALVQIELTLESAGSASDWNNVGEISSFEDEDGMAQTDVDSTPDGDPSNDGPMEDNATDGTNGDEDDSDFAFPEITDLALQKTIATPGPYSVGQNLSFDITVFNQGTTDAYNIEINDVLPCGFEFVGPTSWTHSVSTNTATTIVAQTTPLEPGESITVSMDVIMISCSGAGAYRNSAEIAGSTDEDGNPQDDSDSTPDDDPTNDGPMEDNATDGTNGDEDDSDFAEIKIFDLALQKTLVTPGPHNFGDPLVFEIEVINQGTENLQNISIAEYIPSGYSIDYTSPINTDWAGGATTPTTATTIIADPIISGPLAAGTSFFIQIELILEASTDPDAWKNVAEISGMEDEDGIVRPDVDSTPDDDPDNDGDMTDDATDGENGDEDDSDFAIPVVNDLALTKGITTPGPYAPGQVINYAIEVFNQGNQDAWNIEVVDYLPCGLLWNVNNPGWNYNPSNNTAVITAAQTTPLTPGNSLIVNIELEIFQCAEDDAFTNTSEIAGSTDEDGNPLPDTDSTPDDDPNNDGDMTDDATDGSNGDEDDSDFATFEIFDLALRKTASTPGPYSYGQTIVFDVTVFNQGTEPVQNVEVVDYIPGGFSYDDTDPINANWVGAGATPLDVTQVIPGPLNPGDSMILQVALVFEMGPADWKNVSEIASFEDEDGNMQMDIDSTPDSDPNNDGDMEDNATDGTNGDEDDSDFELIEVFDLALKKTIVTPGPYSYGQTVTYAITVYNQGNINAMNVGIADYLTCGFEYASNPAWTYDIANHVATQTVATTTPLVPGDSIVVNIDLTMVQCAEPGAYTNTAEIFGATDEDGEPQEDIDSTADSDPDNDGDAEDDATDGTNGDEDDADIAVIEIFDLALAKTISTPPPYSIGGSIVFDLVVYNQGSETVQNISVADYVPAGYDYDASAALNSNWIGSGPTPTTLTQTIAGPMAPGDSAVIQIELILNQAPADWQNTAEISGFEDEDGMMQDDVDSTPDDDPNNDGPMEDNAVDGENGDEDDSDFALPEIFDLANKKVITTPGPYSYGQTVSFDIIVYNQGNVNAMNVDVVDYLPCGYEYVSNAAWAYDATNHVASTTVAETTPLLPGDSIVINIDLTLIQCAESGAYTNTSEIAGATDENGDPQEDIDSTADSDPDNEGPVSDNDTDGTGGDEDDSDIAVIEIFDLALAKTISTPPTYSYGQTLIFDLVVYNQGSETVQNISVADYVPAGYTYDAADPTNANWMGAGPTPTTLTQTIAGPLTPGDSTIVQIALILNQSPMDWANTAEISGFEDEDGMMQDDVDSTPDDDPNNDGPMEDNATDGENGDEDDSDFALPEIFDLALRKDLVTPGPYAYGMEVTFRIWVFNQGSMDANNIEITEYIPSGFEYDPALIVNTTNGWSNFVTASPSTTINTTPALAPGDSTYVEVALIIQESTEPGAHKNTSEISGAEDGDGNPQEDTDSTADNDPDNDGDMTDGETDNGSGDEDDSDFELVPIYDLALTKKLVTDPPYSVGQVLEFAIEVCNQASLTVTNIEVSDYVPVGYSYDPGLNAGWVGAGPTPTTVVYTMPGPIEGGECLTVPIFLTLQNAATSLDWQNVGEISNFQDEDGNDQDDVDSTPDDDPNNDGDMEDDVTDGTNGDEDDSDFAGPDMLSEPMIANVKSTTNTNLLADGNLDITFLIGVKNTGLFDLTELSLIDDIASQIPSFNQMSVNVSPNVVMTSTTATSPPALDPAYDGSGNIDIFAGSTADLLEPGQEIWVEITIEIDPTTTTWPIDNQSEAGGTGLDDNGNEIGDVTDPSDSGTDFEGDNPGEPGDEGTSDDPTEVDCIPASLIVTTNEAEICAGEEVTFAVSSDIPGVTYHWREVGSTTVISTSATPTFTDVMTSRTYEVTLQVPAGMCVYDVTEEFDIVVNQPPMVDLTASYALNADCSPSDLSFTAVDGAGAGFVSYDWSGPSGFTSSVANPILPTANSLNNGTYTVVVTDANGCTATESVQVLDVVSPVMQPVINSTGPACQGEEIVLNINQYSGSVVTYTWTTPAGITTDISGFGTNELVLSPVSDAQAGTYVLDIVVDGCQLQAEYVVEVEESPVVDANFVTVDACDGGSFEFTSNATGVNNLTYEWTGPNNWTSTLPNPNLNDVDVTFNGQYTVAVTSAAGCVTISDFVIDNILPPPAPASIDLTASEICDGESIELSSSAEGSMFEWISSSDSPGSLAQPGMTTTSGSTSFGPGHPEYQSGPWRVRVTDANGCVTESETINVQINPIPVAVANNAGPVCDGDQLELFASEVNGAVYNWYDADPALGGVLVSTDQNPTITNLAQGSHTYFLQVDLDGCFSDVVPTTAQIATPPQIVNDFIYTPNVDCAATELELTSTTTMGTSTDLTYTWTGPNGFTSDEENPIIPTVGSDFNGSYTVMVTDEFGCTAISTVEVGIIPDAVAFTPVINSSGPACEGDEIILTTQIQTGTNVTYTWTTPNGMTNISGIGTNELILSQLTELDHEGSYEVMVNVDGCEVNSVAFVVEIGSAPTAVTDFMYTANVDCSSSDLNLSSAVTVGDTPIESYLWTGPNGFTSTVPNPILASAGSVNNGSYVLTVTDEFGCTGVSTVEISGIVDGLASTPIINSTGPACPGEEVVLTTAIQDGINVTYTWTTPNGTTNISGLNSNELIITPLTDADHEGMYTVTINVDGCEIESPVFFVDVFDPPAAAPMPSMAAVCDGNDLEIFANPNTDVTAFNWTGPNGFTSTAANPVINGVDQTYNGEYTLTLTGTNGCTSSTSVMINNILDEPEMPTIAAQSICDGEALVMTTSTAGQMFEWIGPNGQSQQTLDLAGLTTNTGSTSLDPTSEAYVPGMWSVRVTDANGCVSTSAEVMIEINDVPVVIANNNSGVCAGDNVQLIGSDWAGADYYWYDADPAAGGVLVSTDQNPLLINPDAGTQDYFLVVERDGCQSEPVMTSVVVNEPPVVDPNFVYNLNLDCSLNGLNLESNVTGNGPFTYIWQGPNNFTSTEEDPEIPAVSEEANGSYTVSIVDANGCEAFAAVEVANIADPVAQPVIASSGPACDNGIITLTAQTYSGSNITYTWTTPAGVVTDISGVNTNEIIISPVDSTIHEGDYVLTVNVDGCELTSTAYNLEIFGDPLAAQPMAVDMGVCEGDNILLESEFADSYFWTGPNGFTSDLQNPTIDGASLAAGGTYWLTVVNEQGCESDPTPIIIEVTNRPETPTMVANQSEICADEPMQLRTSTDCDSYLWIGPLGSSSTTLATHPKLTSTEGQTWIFPEMDAYRAGMWSVVCVNEFGCESEPSNEIEIEINDIPVANPVASADQLCANEAFQLFAGNGYPEDAVFQWFDSDPTTGAASMVSNLEDPMFTEVASAGTHTFWLAVTVNGCESMAMPVSVEVSPEPMVIADNDGTECIEPTTDVNLDAVPAAGIAPFTYSWSGPNGFASIESNPILPNAINEYSGTYIVTITDGNGCTAEAETVVDVTVVPEEPFLVYNGQVCEGEDITIVAPEYEGFDIVYEWVGPDGTTTTGAYTNGNIIVIEDASTLASGNYQVQVTVDGCTSVLSEDLPIEINEIPVVSTVNNADPCVGPDDDVTLTSTVTGGEGPYTYFWSGPNGFTSNSDSPLLPNVGTINSGTYTMYVVDVNGCQSSAMSTEVFISEMPATPSLEMSTDVACEGEEIFLTTQAYDGDDVVYTWIMADGSSVQTTVPSLLIGTLDATIHNGLITVTVNVDGCDSQNAVSRPLEVNAIPTAPIVINSTTSTSPACEGEGIQLQTTFIPGATYQWFGPNGFTSDLPNPSILSSTMTDAGVYSLIVTLNGCSSEIVTSEVIVQETPPTPIVENDGPSCEDDEILLSIANPDAETLYDWFRTIDDVYVGTGASLVLPAGTSSAGSYYAIGSVLECRSERSGNTEVQVDVASNDIAYAGIDRFICEHQWNLNASPVNNGEGVWSMVNQGNTSEIASPSSESTLVTELQLGANQFVWSINSGACGVTSSDTVTIWVNDAPTATNDDFEIALNERVTDNVILNDQPNAADYMVTNITTTENGELVINDDGSFTYVPNENFVGTDVFMYEICHVHCPENCVTATVSFKVGDEAECFAPTLITPNEDGWNDNFVVPCLANFPGSSICIFNRWGDQVFLDENYQNNWNGTYQGNGETLPVGTYYYVIEVADGNDTKMSGYVFIQR